MRVKANLHETDHFNSIAAQDDKGIMAKKKHTYWDEVRARRKSQQVKQEIYHAVGITPNEALSTPGATKSGEAGANHG